MKSFVLVSVLPSISSLWLQHPTDRYHSTTTLLSHDVRDAHDIFHPSNRCVPP